MDNDGHGKISFWQFINSSFFLLLLGFGLSSVVGTYIADRLQQRSWERQSQLEEERRDYEWSREKKFELLRRKLDDGQNSLESISDLINLRFYRLQNAYINIVQGNVALANSSWNEYFDVVEEWNVKLLINQNNIRRLVNEEESILFNNYETDNPDLVKAYSIHGQFYLAHQEILDLLRCLRRENCRINSDQKESANEMLRLLDYNSDAFVDRISDIFFNRTIELESLKLD
ncbi:hypothetical protein CLV84_0001 [Neolewinella xylanilytica]|uniref:Uncharacterized protein n=1 Tax=Neolewinella xylanilytica TaxID=1514080 RepID=A0A2S6IBX2_9BACT|nr:hypothetical protein [Neolewinella xylanilytica]PPK89086.1 hypothetical protein CLV84_0001 [Neolewinella xylanilytica]